MQLIVLVAIFIGLLLPAWWLQAPPARAGITVEAEYFRVYDGDTIHLYPKDGRTVKVRLWGISAPELREKCGKLPIGSMSRQHLVMLIRNGPVLCTQVRNQTSYDRIVAICKANGQDLGWAMVRDGFAFDWPRYSKGWYHLPQVEAEREGRGLWGETCP